MNRIVLDVEGTPNKLAYDVAFSVIDGNCNVIETHSYIVADTFDNTNLMQSAYYADKLPLYQVLRDEFKRVSMCELYNVMHDVIRHYKVREVWAYNCAYDKGVLNNSVQTYSNGFIKEFLPSDVDFCDLAAFAGATVCNSCKYVRFCFSNSLITAKNNPKTSAETVYAYLTKNPAYQEFHIAYEDVNIETYILKKCLQRRKKIVRSGSCWKHAAAIAKTLM